MKSALLCAALIAVAGCVTTTPRAQQIQLHPSTSSQLATCKRLGPVYAEASGWSQLNWADVDQQAKNNLREAAVAKWGDQVDSVALINIDHTSTKATANGIAYRCF